MRVVIFGATGRIGREAQQCALESGHQVRGVSRGAATPDLPGATAMAADVRDKAAVHRVVSGVDAVIAALGPRSNTIQDEDALALGMTHIVAAMTDLDVRRLVVLSGAGIDVPNDHKPLVDRMASAIVRRMAQHVVRAKQREYAVIASSDLDWTALRPPIVTNGPAKGYRLDLRLRPGARVTRADVGQALCDQLKDDSFIHRAPFVLPPSR